MAGIAAGDQHHGSGGTLVDLDGGIGQAAVGGIEHQLEQVALQTRKDHLGFRVAHAAVVFDDKGVAVDADQAEEDKAAVIHTLFAQTLNGRLNDARFDLFHQGLIDERHRRNGAHAAGVEAGIAFADPLVVFGHGQQFIGLAVGQGEHGELDPVEEFLDHYRRTGRAELAAEHGLQFVFGFGHGAADEHPFAGCQSVGLEHDRRLATGQVAQAFFELGAAELAVGGGRDVSFLHEFLGERLAAFEQSALPGRADQANVLQAVVGAEEIDDPFDQRCFRADYDQVDAFFERKGGDRREIGERQVDVLAGLPGTRIARGDEQLFAERALPDLPGKGVFAAAVAQQ